MCICTCHGAPLEVRGHLGRASSLLLSCGSQGSNPGCQAWQHVSLPSCQPYFDFYFERQTKWTRLGLNSFWNTYHHDIWDSPASAFPGAGCTDLSFCKTESVYPLHTTRHYPFSWSLAVTVSMILSVPVIPTAGPHFYIFIPLIFHLV